jgi:hypothetical protein
MRSKIPFEMSKKQKKNIQAIKDGDRPGLTFISNRPSRAKDIEFKAQGIRHNIFNDDQSRSGYFGKQLSVATYMDKKKYK